MSSYADFCADFNKVKFGLQLLTIGRENSIYQHAVRTKKKQNLGGRGKPYQINSARF